MDKPIRILITGAGATAAIGVLKGLRATSDSSIYVFMGDLNRDCAGAHLGDGFVEMPPVRADEFGAKAVTLCREHRIDLVIPMIDDEFPCWCKLAGRLRETGTTVVVSPAAALAKCMEKDQTYAS